MNPEELARQLGGEVSEETIPNQERNEGQQPGQMRQGGFNPDDLARQLGGEVEDNPIVNAYNQGDPNKQKAIMGASLDTTNSFLDKLLNVSDKVFKPFDVASKALFGTTSKTVGTLLATPILESQGRYEEAKALEKNINPTNIAFTGLELMPGGGMLTKYLTKLPGGAAIAKNITKQLAKVPANLKAKAIEKYASIFKAGTKDAKALVEKVVPELLEQNKIITSTKSLGKEAAQKAMSFGEQIGAWFEKLPAGVKKEVKPVVEKLEVLKSKYRLQGKDINKTAINAINETLDNIKTTSGEMSIKNLRKLRQIWDEHYSVSKGLDDIANYKKKAERVGADAIRDVLAKESPELAELNKNYAFWKNVENLADYASSKSSQVNSAASRVVGGVVGAVSGSGTAGKIANTIIGTQVGNLANKAITSPAWKSISVVYKNKMANYLMSGQTSKLTNVLKRVITIGKNLVE